MLHPHRTPRALAATATLLMGASSIVVGAAPRGAHHDAFDIAAGYHRALSQLSARHPTDAAAAVYELRRLTADAIAAQSRIELEPCFARWWAYELMGLELTSLAHQLREDGDGSQGAAADVVERLGTRMWAEAMTLVPDTAAACFTELDQVASVGQASAD